MKSRPVLSIAAAIVFGLAAGPLCGNVFFGIAVGSVLAAGMGLWLWHRQQRSVVLHEAQQLLLMRALAERALRDGEVTSCQHCKRTMRKQAQRCLFCGAHRLEGPLR